MEGLLPMIFRVIRKTKSRRKYRCLSSGGALRNNDFYHESNQGQYSYHGEPASHSRVDDYGEKIDYRRYNSVTEFSNGFSSSPKKKSHSIVGSTSKELVSYKVSSVY
jgi:hypothetical protein